MDAKKILIPIFLVALIVAFSFISFDNKRQIIIKASLYDVARQINDLNNWKRWNVDLKNDSLKIEGSLSSDQFAAITSTYSYALHHINPLAVLLTRSSNGSSTSSLIEVVSLTDTTTAIIWSEKMTFFKLIRCDTIAHYSRQTHLNNLKKLMEDVNYRYRFVIKLVPVKDTLILTAEMPVNDSSKIVSDLYQELQAFIKENKLPADKNYFYTTQLSDNKIAVGVPVYRQIQNHKNIKFLQLPRNGRLIEGNYSGKISDKRSIYNAINNFMLDQHLKQVALPLEQYNVADTILQPNSNVNLKIYFPVF